MMNRTINLLASFYIKPFTEFLRLQEYITMKSGLEVLDSVFIKKVSELLKLGIHNNDEKEY